MRTKTTLIASSLMLGGVVLVGSTIAGSASLVGGQTSVSLDTTKLTGAGLQLSGISDDVIVPGSLPTSVAFKINSPDDTPPTTFSYDPANFAGTAQGNINHRGSVFFNDGSVELGDFTIANDPNRGGSGFYVASNSGLNLIAFDVTPSSLQAELNSLSISGGLNVSPELAAVLENESLEGENVGEFELNGTAIGTASVVPTPTAAAAGLICLAACGMRRRRDAVPRRGICG